jgi:hypothetical protein
VSQSIPESVVVRIRKLLALANDGRGNANEAEVASQKAQALLAEYNLEMSQIGENEPNSQTSEDAAREKTTGFDAATADWQVTLMAAIAQNNFCMHWVQQIRDRRLDGTGKIRLRRRHCLIGRRVNIVIVRELYTYLTQTMERLCPYEDRRDRSSRSWFDGCSDRLRSRLEEQRRASEAESRQRRGEASRGDGSSLVLSDVYSSEEDLNNDLRFGYAPGTTAARRAEREARHREYEEEYRRRAAEQKTEETTEVSTKVETPAQKARRAEREARRDARWWEAYQRRQAREAARVDQRAYAHGSSVGGGIGLDRQVSVDKVAGRLS